MIKTSTDVLGCFWLPPHYHKLTSSGVDQNTVKPYSTKVADSEFKQHFHEHILPELRSNIVPYQDGKKYMRKSKLHGRGFCDVVNDALKQIYKNRKGYVFTQEQLVEIIKFIPDIDVSYSDGIYFVWK